MEPSETLRRFINDLEGPRILGEPQQGPKPQLPPIVTNFSEPSLSCTDKLIVPNPSPSEQSTSPSTLPGSSGLSSQESASSKTSIAPSDHTDSLVGDIETMSFGGPDRYLPCILNEIVPCSATFHLSERADWHAHGLSHYLGASPPTHALCIFCDNVFDSNDPATCWSDRMNHIADHFENGWTMEGSRPDFRVIEDMWIKGCIPDRVYQHIFKHTERPPCDGLKPHDYIPKEVLKKQEAANRVPVPESRREIRDWQRSRRSAVVGSKRPKSKATIVT